MSYQITDRLVIPKKPIPEEEMYTQKQLFVRKWYRIRELLVSSGVDLSKIELVGKEK